MATSPTKKVSSVSENGLAIIRTFEGLRLKAYKDVVGIFTIGYGTTHYENGQAVRMGDVTTKERAIELLKFESNAKSYVIAQSLDKYAVKLNQNQFDSVVSLAYNIGIAAFLGSTVFRLIKLNPKDPNITKAFSLWCKGTKDGKKITIPALVNRRKEEAKLYFT